MKNKITKCLCVLSLLTCSAVTLNACKSNIFTNPGDYLGGGGTGIIPTEIDNSSKESQIVSTISTDLSDLHLNTTSSIVDANDIYTSSTITTAGDYLLSGNYTEGVTIKVGDNETVHIFLKNANISNSNGIAIQNQNKKSSVIITLIGNNAVSNSGDDVNAIHIKGNLSINGEGTLNVTSNSKSAIKVSKSLCVVDSNINIISSQSHGITAQTIVMEDCSVNIDSCLKDGLQTECNDDTTEFTLDEGYVSLKNVEYTCSVLGDGIQADTLVYINGGTYNISTTANFVSKSTSNMTKYGLTSDDFKYVASGNWYKRIAADSNTSSMRYAMIQSSKGIKVGEIKYEDSNGDEVTVTDGDYYIIIKSGEFNINSDDDAIHTNSGNATLSNGSFVINTLDDGICADNLLTISGGTYDIQNCYEGVEGAYVEITGGTINILSQDDGINAASDDTGITEHIIISGGNVTINASGDGIDSNGSILIDGDDTVVVVHGPTSGADAGLDADKGIVINGGYVFASSTLGMVETPSTNSHQYILSFAQRNNISIGTNISIVDSNNNVLFSIETQKVCQSIIISIPKFVKNSSYKIYGGDTQLATFTISNTITSVGSSTSPNQPGGMPGRR